MKRPLEGTGEGNAKKSKTFHSPQQEQVHQELKLI